MTFLKQYFPSGEACGICFLGYCEEYAPKSIPAQLKNPPPKIYLIIVDKYIRVCVDSLQRLFNHKQKYHRGRVADHWDLRSLNNTGNRVYGDRREKKCRNPPAHHREARPSRQHSSFRWMACIQQSQPTPGLESEPNDMKDNTNSLLFCLFVCLSARIYLSTIIR